MDGSPAAFWSPAAERAALTAGLGGEAGVGTVRPVWRSRPASWAVEVSADGRSRHRADGSAVRYVRVSVRGAGAALAERDVRR